MKKRYWTYLVVGTLFLGIFLGRFILTQATYRPTLTISGDVDQVLEFRRLVELEIPLKQNNVLGLEKIMEKAKPWKEPYHLLLVGEDGLMASNDHRIEHTKLQFSTEHGWEIIDTAHPVSSQVKHLEEIVVVTENMRPEQGVTLFDLKENMDVLTPGRLYEAGLKKHWVKEGSSSIQREDEVYEVDVFTSLWKAPVKSKEADQYLIVTADGGMHRTKELGQFIYAGNCLDYQTKEGEVYQNVRGILLDPPGNSNADAFHDALFYIEQNEKVMVILLDGFSFQQYQYAMHNGYAPFLEGLEQAAAATTYYKPVTNTGYAGIVSGQGPLEHGIHDRNDRVLETSIFDELERLDKRAQVLEADVKILDWNNDFKPILHVDHNQNGSIDDDIMATAISSVSKPWDYLFVHFHGIDDAGHLEGPFGEKTLREIQKKDAYLQKLSVAFDGKIIVTSDHGMHETKNGGDHGVVCLEDFIVPYLIIEGGQ